MGKFPLHYLCVICILILFLVSEGISDGMKEVTRGVVRRCFSLEFRIEDRKKAANEHPGHLLYSSNKNSRYHAS